MIYINSVWQENSTISNYNSLNQDIKTDVLIIGGGMAGILCAYYLKNYGIDYVLLESSSIANGVTKDTSAKITSQHNLIYNYMISKFGIEYAKDYYNITELALKKYKNISTNIDCDFETKDSYVYTTNDVKKIHEELEALNKINAKASYCNKIELPIHIIAAIKMCNQAQFNPLKFISNISKDLNIYENSHVYKLDNKTAYTKNGQVQAKKIIIASHFPFINTHGYYFMKMYQQRSYFISLKNAKNINGMYIDESKNGLSFRNYKDMLLVGGSQHKTGSKTVGWKNIECFAKKTFPEYEITHKWSTQDCITLDNIPYIGNYSKSTPWLYVATGFNKWGMTSSMVSAMILSDLVLEKKNDYANIFNPSRSMLTPRLAGNTLNAISNMLSLSKKRCPHLGCALKYNSLEHSWDCPCHGSRFTKDGKLLQNPSIKNLKD